MEAVRTHGEEELRQILERLSDSGECGAILRAKGVLKIKSKEQSYFGLVPEEYEVRKGQPAYTGRSYVIGSKLEEGRLKELFHTEQEKAMTVPIYLFTGFLESSKATPIKETLLDTGFNTGECTLLLARGEGMENYGDDFLIKTDTTLVAVDNEAAVDYEFLKKCDDLTKPDRVMTGFNGTWSLNSFVDVEYPFDWLLVQIPSTVDAPTFEVYPNSIRSLIYNQLLHLGTAIFNHCDETTEKLYLKSNIKAINKDAQLIYETRDGQITELGDDEMSFGLRMDVVRIAGGGYGLWYMDALEHPRKYEGKNVELKGKVITTRADGVLNIFVFGRHAVVCYADNTLLVGLLRHYGRASSLVPKGWVSITTQIAVEFDEEYQGNIPVLYIKQLTEVLPLDDGFVYSN